MYSTMTTTSIIFFKSLGEVAKKEQLKKGKY